MGHLNLIIISSAIFVLLCCFCCKTNTRTRVVFVHKCCDNNGNVEVDGESRFSLEEILDMEFARAVGDLN
jgi:hypothetical protein